MSKFLIKKIAYSSKKQSNFKDLVKKDYFFICFFGFSSLIVFINAREDFSYDYIHYIRYFEVLGATSFDVLLRGIYDVLPLPYVVIPPSGFFEIGFGILAWLLMQAFENASLGYAIIASISISARFWVLRKMDIGWSWIIAVNVYAITLFEANAIRLGCAVTLFMYGLLLISQRKSIVFVLLVFILAGLFHLQIFFLVIFFLFVYFFKKWVLESKISLMAYIVIIIFGGVSVKFFSDFLIFGKYYDYLGVDSLAGGINVVTSLGLIVALIFLAELFLMPRNNNGILIFQHGTLVWIAASMVIIPALVLYIFVDNMGALGDRVWQMAFVVFAFSARAKIWRRGVGGAEGIALSILIIVANINIIYRYPLSNFFYPLISYVEIDSSFQVN